MLGYKLFQFFHHPPPVPPMPSVSLYIGQKLKSAGLDTLIKMEYVFDAFLGDDSRQYRETLCQISRLESQANTLNKQFIGFRARNNRIPIEEQQKYAIFEHKASKLPYKPPKQENPLPSREEGTLGNFYTQFQGYNIIWGVAMGVQRGQIGAKCEKMRQNGPLGIVLPS